jgi:hypothetical protein
MAGLSMTWNVHAGWADVTVADYQAEAQVDASYISAAAEDFLTAVARLVLGDNDTRVQFMAGTTTFRWFFCREGTNVSIRLLELPDGRKNDSAGTEIWSSQQNIDTLSRVVIRCFDKVARKYGENGYLDEWRRPFPRLELEALRTAWRANAPKVLPRRGPSGR